MGKKKKVNRSHSDEFKREAVGLLESRGERTAAEVAASLGVQSGQLYTMEKGDWQSSTALWDGEFGG